LRVEGREIKLEMRLIEMAKMTKRNYEKARAVLEMKKTKLAETEETMKAMYEAHVESGVQMGEKMGEMWNALYDAQYEVDEEIADLDRAWDTRNWTAADWNLRELIANNVD
jgi:hypothetical protein